MRVYDLFSKGNPTYPCFAYPRHPQTPKWKEFRTINCWARGFGVCETGVCWKVLRFFGMVKIWPFQWKTDLQLNKAKGHGLNHLGFLQFSDLLKVVGTKHKHIAPNGDLNKSTNFTQLLPSSQLKSHPGHPHQPTNWGPDISGNQYCFYNPHPVFLFEAPFFCSALGWKARKRVWLDSLQKAHQETFFFAWDFWFCFQGDKKNRSHPVNGTFVWVDDFPNFPFGGIC